MLGEVLDGKYRIARLLGQGGMGSVFEAEEITSGRRVAVKVILTDRRLSPELIRRFRREAKAAMAVPSEHIAQVLDGGTNPATGAPYMVMEYLTGEDLEAVCRRLGPLPPAVALEIVGQACEGLRQAHEAGITHRDIKPANLFLARGAENGKITVKILDFGIAKIQPNENGGSETTGLTSTGAMLGSPLYMSPEQARGIKEIDHRTDLWSLGAVLYRALAGRAPHHGLEALGDLIIALCSRGPDPVQKHAPWVPAEIAAIVNGALQLLPAGRYQTAAAMLAAIQPLLPENRDLREGALVPLSDAERGVVAARFEAPDVDRAAKPPTHERTAWRSAEDKLEIVEPPAATPVAAASGMAPMDTAAGVTGARAGPRRPMVLGFALAAIVGAATLYRMTSAPTGTAAAPIDAPAPGGAPAPGSAVGAASVLSPAVRRIAVRIAPPDASVEVNGARTELSGGLVEIVGSLGSEHRVRLFQGDRELTQTVVITEGGATPATLSLSAAPSGQASASSPPAVARGGPPRKANSAPSHLPEATTAPAPPPPPSDSQKQIIRESFE